MHERQRVWNRAAWNRLCADIHALRVEVDASSSRLTDSQDRDGLAWLAEARTHLDRAEALASAPVGRLGPTWRALHRAREAWLGTLPAQRLRLEADDLRHDVKSLRGGRRKMVDEWLRGLDGGDLPGERARVVRAMRTRNEHWEMHFHGLTLQEARLAGLVAGLAVLVGLVLMFQQAGSLRLLGDEPAGMVAAVAALGAVGGTTNAMAAVLKQDHANRLPHQVGRGPWLVSRPLLGAASALVVTAAVAHGLLGLEVTNSGAYLPLAFVSGFSEVLLLRMVDRMTGQAKPEPAKGKEAEAGPSEPGGEPGTSSSNGARHPPNQNSVAPTPGT